MNDIEIATIQKNQREEIRIALTTYNGHRLVQVRVWVPGAAKDGADIPTKAGLACRVALLPQLIEALTVAHKAASTESAQEAGDGSGP